MVAIYGNNEEYNAFYCQTPPVEGAGADSLPVPYPGRAKKKKKTFYWEGYMYAGAKLIVKMISYNKKYCSKITLTGARIVG
jgi:hypothetical protein